MAEAWQPTNLRWWYDSLLDYLIANPESTQKEAAAHFGRTQAQISNIMRSDMFKARYSQRRQEMNNRIAEGVATELSRTALASLSILNKRLVEDAAKIPTVTVLDVASKTLQALGYGPKPAGANPVNATQVNITVGKDVLSEARNKMLENERQRQPPLLIEDKDKVA